MRADGATWRDSSVVRRTLTAPLVHFLAIGGLLFALAPEERPLIVVTASAAAKVDDGGSESTSAQERLARVQQSTDEAILLREAQRTGLPYDSVVSGRLARIGTFLSLHEDDTVGHARELGLDHSDVVIRRYLAEMMRLAIAREADHPLPTEEELEAHLSANAERFGMPDRIRLHHVFVSSRHGPASAQLAARLLAQLSGHGPEVASSLGDPFPFKRSVVASSTELERRFGPDFIAALDRSAVRRWQGPVASTYGVHLVWIEEHLAAKVPPVAEIRGRLLHHLLRERRARHLRQRLDSLRDRYEIRIE